MTQEVADTNLRNYAYSLVINGIFDKKNIIPLEYFGIWNDVYADLFVTAYYEAGNTNSDNVWCCYSNGDINNQNTVLENLKGAVNSCLIFDNRHPPLGKNDMVIPAEVDLTILAPKKRWIKIDNIELLNRKRGRALYVKTFNGSAFYIPSVWNENLDWTAEDIIKSLAKKAHGNFESIVEIYEVPVYEIPTKSLETKTFVRNRGFFLQHGGYKNLNNVLENAWHFYYDYSRDTSEGAQLAYKIILDNPKYDNEGAWVRSISDVISFENLNKYIGNAHTIIEPYIDYLINIQDEFLSNNDLQTRAVWIEFQYLNIQKSEKNNKIKSLLNSFKELSPGIYDTDLSFANPQIIMVLANHCGKHKINGYLKTIDSQIEKAIKTNGAFAANWIAQALYACYPIANKERKHIRDLASDQEILQKTLKEAAFNGDSITIRACAITGLEALYKIKNSHDLYNFIKNAINELISYQLDNGGFSYALDNTNLIRTDVTSHVVEAILTFVSFQSNSKT